MLNYKELEVATYDKGGTSHSCVYTDIVHQERSFYSHSRYSTKDEAAGNGFLRKKFDAIVSCHETTAACNDNL
jgi:hypothetical protein